MSSWRSSPLRPTTRVNPWRESTPPRTTSRSVTTSEGCVFPMMPNGTSGLQECGPADTAASRRGLLSTRALMALSATHAADPRRQLANSGRKYRTTGARSVRPNFSARGCQERDYTLVPFYFQFAQAVPHRWRVPIGEKPPWPITRHETLGKLWRVLTRLGSAIDPR